ncbi:MAG: hypothetical protein AAFO69_02090 [Bacteroidota bacterium]
MIILPAFKDGMDIGIRCKDTLYADEMALNAYPSGDFDEFL